MKSFIEHAAMVTKSVGETQPVLKGVMHYENGLQVVTDGFRLYRKEHGHSLGKDVLLDAKTMQEIDGNYPETERLWPESEVKTYVSLEINKHVIAAMKQSVKASSVNEAGEKKPKRRGRQPGPAVKISVENQIATFFTPKSFFNQTFTANAEGQDIEILLEYQFFVEALEAILDGCVQSTVMIQIEIRESQRPVIIKAKENDSFKTLLLPIRPTGRA